MLKGAKLACVEEKTPTVSRSYKFYELQYRHAHQDGHTHAAVVQLLWR